MKYKLSLLVGALWLAGCAGSTPYTYYVQPTPLVAEQSTYALGKVTVHLSLGDGAIEGDRTFASEQELQQEFNQYLQHYLKQSGYLAKNVASADAVIDVDIGFKRTFNMGGHSLNKPEVTHNVVLSKDGTKLASFQNGPYLTKYAYLEDLSVDLEIASFNWDAEDEPRDVDLVSKLLVDEIVQIGE